MHKNLRLYLANIQKDHSSSIVRRGFALYAWFWFHTQFWLTPARRRPFTFIMRDWIYPHLPAFLAITAVWFAGLLVLTRWHPCLALILGCLSSMLIAHLVWGSPWKRGEQEWPPYLG